jgi:iron complex transport system substrate-binding protein
MRQDVSSRKRLTIVLLLFLLGLLIAWLLQPEEVEQAGAGGEAPIPRRIIALAPSHVELLFALGVGDRVAGVGEHCFHPPEARTRPACGGTFDPNYEQMLSLRPDLLVVQGRAEKVDAFCRRYGVRILHLSIEDLETLFAGARELGDAVGAEAEAEALIARIQADLDRVAQRVAGRPRPKVFLCLGRQAGSLRSLFSAGGPTFLTEMLRVAGGANVLADVATRYPTISKEGLVARKPDVILEIHGGADLSAASRRRLLADWAALPSLPAVAEGRIHVLTDDFLLLPGPRVARVAERFADVLHPDAEAGHGR